MKYKQEYLEIKLDSQTLETEAWDIKVLIKSICSKNDFSPTDAETVEHLSKYMRLIHRILEEKGTKIIMQDTDGSDYYKNAFFDLVQTLNEKGDEIRELRGKIDEFREN